MRVYYISPQTEYTLAGTNMPCVRCAKAYTLLPERRVRQACMGCHVLVGVGREVGQLRGFSLSFGVLLFLGQCCCHWGVLVVRELLLSLFTVVTSHICLQGIEA